MARVGVSVCATGQPPPERQYYVGLPQANHVACCRPLSPALRRLSVMSLAFQVFDIKLKETIYKLPFDKILTLKNVRHTINEADGYQPHIIAPEAGYRRLIEDGLTLLRDPAAKSVEQCHQILKSIVTAAINEVPELSRYVNLKSEIMAHSAREYACQTPPRGHRHDW